MGTSSSFLAANPSRNLSAARSTDSVRLLGADGLDYWCAAGQLPYRTKLDRPIRVATFGDSTSNWVTADTNTDQEKLTMTFPASGTTNYVFDTSKVSVSSESTVLLVANGGINGNTTQQMLDRSKAVSSKTRRAIIDVIKKRPDVVLLRGGSVNDVATFNASTINSTVDATIYRHVSIVKSFTSNGVVVVDSGILGFDGNGGYTPEDLAACRSWGVYMNSTFETMAIDDPLWLFAKTEEVISANGAFISGMSSDGTHLTSKGNRVLGYLEFQILNSAFVGGGITGDVIYDGQLDYQNGTSSTPANHLTTPTNGTITNATCTVDGYKCQFTSTLANSKIKIEGLRNNFAGLVSGDNLIRRQSVFVTDLDGNEVPYTLDCRVADLNFTGDTKRVVAEYSYGEKQGMAIINSPFNAVDSYANLGTCSSFVQITFPSVAEYLVTIKPEIISKYTPLN